MVKPRGNQPMSSSGNKNVRTKVSNYKPRRGKGLKYRRYKKTGISAQKRVDNKQIAAINTLTKKVYNLEMSKFGDTQQNYHALAEQLKPAGTKPICFDMNDFTCERGAVQGGRVYQHDPAAVPPEEPVEVTHWIRNAQGNNFYWQNQNEDQPDGGSYLALDATYFFSIRGNRSLSDTRIRIDLIVQKEDVAFPSFATAGTQSLALPDTLIHMKHLTDPYQNRINPTYFKKIMTKIVYINSSKTNSYVKGTTGNRMRFSVNVRPNRVMIQNETNPQVGGGIVAFDSGGTGEQSEYDRGNFGPLNVPTTQPLWCIISTDDASGGDEVIVEVSRRIRWKDSLGSAGL